MAAQDEDQEDRWRKRRTVAAAVARGTGAYALFIAMLFVVVGLMNGWEYALNYIVGFAMFIAGFAALTMLSVDSRLSWEGAATTLGTITNRKKADKCCFSSSNSFYIQYTYSVEGVMYENKEAWFQCQDPLLDDGISDVVTVKYLQSRPDISLPMAAFCGNTKTVSPSAGSLRGPCCTWNTVVFGVPYLMFFVANILMLKKALNLENELMVTFLSHLVAIPAGITLYYFGWMRRRERKQRFTSAHLGDGDQPPTAKTLQVRELA